MVPAWPLVPAACPPCPVVPAAPLVPEAPVPAVPVVPAVPLPSPGPAPHPTANAVDSGLEPKYLGLIYNPGAPLEGLPSIAPAGNQKPHNNMQPSLALRYCIALDGIYPQPGS